MADPKPITITYVDSASYTGPDPQPFAVVGDEAGAPDLTGIDGYDAGEIQTLKNVNGTFTWVTDEA